MSRFEIQAAPACEPPRFFTPRTLGEVMRSKLELERQSSDYDPWSRTPFDALRLKIKGGLLYDESALLYMEHMQLRPMQQFEDETEDEVLYRHKVDEWVARRLVELEDAPNQEMWLSVTREIKTQHFLKQRRNDSALKLLRDDTRVVSPNEAERIMQVRAGVAPLPTMLEFLARYQEIKALELMKATRPLDPHAILMARVAFMKTLGSLDEPNIAVELRTENIHRVKIKPDKELKDIPDPRIVVLKTNLARVAVEIDGQKSMLDIVWRDSGVILDPRDDISKSFGVLRNDDGEVVAHVAPIAVTAYAKLAPSE